jgi:HAMP domain-containing protein/CheY-like chemotaxis protein/signal transduction histidine kinase
MSSIVREDLPGVPSPEPGRLHSPALLAAMRAFRDGDFTVRLPNDLIGIDAEIAAAFNACVENNANINEELARISEAVGRDGSITKRASAERVRGQWREGIESVNGLIDDLVFPMAEAGRVLGAVAEGDLSQQMPLETDSHPLRGEFLRSSRTINKMVDRLNAFASEVTRVAREVGSEGILGGQAQVAGVAGTWKDLTDSVNTMAGNLTSQVRNIANVTTAVANGDLSRKITVEARGEIAELKDTINTMVDQLNAFASEVTRVAREVGSEGKLGGQAAVEGVAGTWKDLTDSVNTMAGNLTSQVRNIANVTTAVANGDLSKKITVDVRGEIAELKDTINTMVDQLNAFASEVTRVAREVGSEGKLGGQARVQGASGTWKDLTDSVNTMAGNLTAQVRNIANVTTAVANGDLSKKITVDVKGEIAELKDTINTMVDQLNAFASEVTRVAREVGSEGKLGGQAEVQGVAGTWKDLTDSVNVMASNLTSQVRNIADVTTAVANGDLSKKITVDVRGEIAELKNTINTMVDQLNAFASEVTRVAREVGSDGMLGGQARVQGAAGTWRDLTDSVNTMASNLTAQVRNIAKVTTAVANGDLSKKITVDVKGEILELKDTINTMVDQLNAFASEVTRVAREVGSEGVLGGQAHVQGVSGVWKDLTDNVNSMAANLTNQVRGIAQVVTGVANGDLKRKLTLQARGEIAQLAETINGMIDTLATFADQVTTVAREVGFDGRLGGQANVPGAAGLWRDLTDNVNQLAAQLTNQIRSISEVATTVTKGDLSRTIEIEAQGEVGELTKNVNEMIQNLRESTRKGNEQDWFKTNLARFTGMLQGQRDIIAVTQLIMSELVPLIEAQMGAFYVTDVGESELCLRLIASYALPRERNGTTIGFGEGLVGQCAIEKQRILLIDVPRSYAKIGSGIGETDALSLIVLPVTFEGDIKAVIELASLRGFSEIHLLFLDQLMQSIGVMLNTISASMRTEELLKQSQSLTAELQSQQLELTQTNDELEEKARLLQERNEEIERRTREIEEARGELERRAEQLSLTSKYKSQFLANMSHELRTPLNSLLILSDQLSSNPEGNMSAKQVEFAQTIRSAGRDLLTLINDVLDLSKIESGTTAIDLQEVSMDSIEAEVRRTFNQIAADKKLRFEIRRDPGIPASITTDPTRLQQILKNLLSNAFKFTAEGSVTLHVSAADGRSLPVPGPAVAFKVTDTGIGIPQEKYHVIFEAFQQADMGTSRKFGGTGLGLSICREIAGLLGGEITLESEVGRGSSFTFVHPVERAVVVPRPERSLLPLPEIAEGDRTLLIVEDDAVFAKIVGDLAVGRGFTTILARTGKEALDIAQRVRPDAITLDIGLPDVDGWSVLSELRDNPETAGIPVHVISGGDVQQRALEGGAVAHLQKPISEETLVAAFDRLLGFAESRAKNVLLVEDDLVHLNAMVGLIGTGEVQVTAVSTADAALSAARSATFDCIIVDLGLPDLSGEELIERIRSSPATAAVPVIVYTGRDLTRDEEASLRRLSSTIVVKDGYAPERLLDELNFFLHRVEADLGPTRRAPEDGNGVLHHKRVLIVDDDARNIFALEAALRAHGMEVLSAESGLQGIETLRSRDDVDIVLMDIMMPEMDGYETIRRIRGDERIASIPIIALTAKAMKGDREACIAAGASEYVSKPVDIEQLSSLLRIWLSA